MGNCVSTSSTSRTVYDAIVPAELSSKPDSGEKNRHVYERITVLAEKIEKKDGKELTRKQFRFVSYASWNFSVRFPPECRRARYGSGPGSLAAFWRSHTTAIAIAVHTRS